MSCQLVPFLEVEVKLHGSSVSKFALTSSNVNIFVDFPAITEKRVSLGVRNYMYMYISMH